MSLDVFVSHAHADLPVVKAFLDLLEGPLGVATDRVFCSAIRGRGVEPGHYFETTIRRSIQDAACSVLILSENFFLSTFCVLELGAVWAGEKPFIPMVLPPLTPDRIRDVLAGVHMLQLDASRDLEMLRETLVRELGELGTDDGAWERARDAFSNDLPRLARRVRTPPPEVYAGYATVTVSFNHVGDTSDEQQQLHEELERLGWQAASSYARNVAIRIPSVFVKKVDQGFLESRPGTIADFERCLRRLKLDVDVMMHFGHDPPKAMSTNNWA